MADSKTNRLVTAAFGAFLVLMAVVTVASADESTRVGAGAVAVVLGLLGVDALISAARNKRSIVSRIGPLP